MRIKKYILVIAGIVFLISLLFAILTKDGSKINNIFIGLMGSSLVSFLIELPDYCIDYDRNKKNFYSFSFNIWFYLNQYVWLINNELKEDNKLITENTFSLNIDEINRLFISLSYIDEYLYYKKPKYKEFVEKTKRIQFELDQNKRTFSCYVNIKKIELLQKIRNENVKTSDIRTQICTLAEKTRAKLDFYENEFKKTMTSKELQTFEKDKNKINEINRKYKESEMEFI